MTTSKIPSHIARELRRHVAPTAAVRSANPSALSKGSTKLGTVGGASAEEAGGRGKGATLAACCAFTAATASIPYFAYHWVGPLNEKDEALTPNQIRRGAFTNSGSRDVGKDPMWDFKTGTRIKDKAYIELFEKDDGPDAIDHDDKHFAAAQRGRR
eukprot:CAMPEP_0197441894 /NCGR_PEP_ID=MMETSP1175-20131217/8035_1 /TAXON_ID=1003142 /ORGANISM="Triceratium dubium, Strain CCMP147" /LENGTH=155 /DNA_ID=CAMNT_0042972253 /DNA_START=8 /DNA_END=475 /DNA_ORIENTATION=+